MEPLTTLLERATYICSFGYWLSVLSHGGGDNRDVAGFAGREASNGASSGKGGLSPDFNPNNAGGNPWSALAKKEVGRRILAEADEIERLEREWKQSYMKPREKVDSGYED